MTAKEHIVYDCKIEECVIFRDEVGIDPTVIKNACSIGLWQRHYKNLEESCKMSCKCDENPDCYFKQQARKTRECERMKYYLTKIRQDELSRLDVEWDEYITECTSTDYSNIITYVEYALGERKDD